MKRQIKKAIAILLAVCFVLSITAATVSAKAENPNDKKAEVPNCFSTDPNRNVVPVGAPYLGMTYDQWSVAWWKWIESIPSSSNPLNDDGKGNFNPAIGQSGKVWFLAGSYVGPVKREIKIPAGKAIFFPIINIVATKDATGDFDTVKQRRTAVRTIINGVTIKEVEVDGKYLKVNNYRVESKPFAFTTIPTDPTDSTNTEFNVLNLSGPGPIAAVSDGYWIMLKPLSEGIHRIRIHGRIDTCEYGGIHYETDVTYIITVKPERR
jgi:hypothetical protein